MERGAQGVSLGAELDRRIEDPAGDIGCYPRLGFEARQKMVQGSRHDSDLIPGLNPRSLGEIAAGLNVADGLDQFGDRPGNGADDPYSEH